MDQTRPRLLLRSTQSGLVLTLMILIAPSQVSSTVYACAIDYPQEVEEQYWLAISRFDLYSSGDDLCTITALGGTELGQFKGDNPTALARRLMTDFGGLWRAIGSETLQPIINVDHPNGSSYWRFRELIDGRRVLNGGVIVETSTSSGRILSIRARFLPDFNLVRDPIIAAPQALETVVATRSARKNSLSSFELIPPPRLSWYFMRDAARLVWEVEVPDTSVVDAPVRHMYLVDALNGDILNNLDENSDAAETCDARDCQPHSGVHEISWSPSADAEFYELRCARDADFVTSVETIYTGKLTEIIEPVVTDTWCQVRACKLEGCSVWIGSMHAAAWPDCGAY